MCFTVYGMATVTDLVKQAMAEAGVNQADIAVDLGITRQAVSQRLTGRLDWKVGELRLVARRCNVSITDLLPADDDAPLPA